MSTYYRKASGRKKLKFFPGNLKVGDKPSRVFDLPDKVGYFNYGPGKL
jgi:hypothetical protein